MTVYAKFKKTIDLPRSIEDCQQAELDLSIESIGKNLAETIGKCAGRLGINIYDRDRVFHFDIRNILNHLYFFSKYYCFS